MSAVPIDISYRQSPGTHQGRLAGTFGRDTLAHSQGMGGISWGAASVGSWLRDEIMVNSLMPHTSGLMAGPGTGPGPGSGVTSRMPNPSSTANQDAVLGTSPPDILFPSLEQDFCRDYSCCGEMLPTLHDLLRHYEEAHISPSPTEEAPVMRRMHPMEMVSTNDVFLPPPGQQPPQRVGGTQDVFGRQPTGFGAAVSGTGVGIDSQPALGGVPPVTPLPSQANPVNGTSGNRVRPSDDEPCIDDPARQLYVMERSENKPYRCPVIGCDKTYKNQNGLKYHRQHGHQNQKLHQNEDGTFSIIDPLSNTPYPDGMGMEKDKPYRCEICGKRYKNLNGLKYHRAHTTH